jgi:hypothetical protein
VSIFENELGIKKLLGSSGHVFVKLLEQQEILANPGVPYLILGIVDRYVALYNLLTNNTAEFLYVGIIECYIHAVDLNL